jgi:hypothetical protein
MTPETAAAWWHLEARFAYALTVWGFTASEDEAAPYAQSIVKNLREDGWRVPLPDRAPRQGRRARPETVTAYADEARAQIRRQRAAAGVS